MTGRRCTVPGPAAESGEGRPDLVGWEVVAADGAVVGTVGGLVTDPSSSRVRYVEVVLHEGLARGIVHEPQLLIPVGEARVAWRLRRVELPCLDRSRVLELPAYLRIPPAPEFEATLRRHFEPHFPGTPLDPRFFRSELYDEERFFAGDAPPDDP